MSYNGVGLKSAKGSSTSGHIQRSLANNDESRRAQLKNYTARRKVDKIDKPNGPEGTGRAKVPSQESMMKHLSRRQIEVTVSELRDELETQDLEEDHIEQKCSELRDRLLKEQETEQRISKLYQTRSQRLKNSGEPAGSEDAAKTPDSRD